MRFRVVPMLLCVGLALAVVPAASPGSAAKRAHVATRLVTFTFSDAGKGRWSTSGDYDIGSMATNYTWKGSAKFRLPTAALANPTTARYSVRGTASLAASWVGDYVGQQIGTPTSGPYHCIYKGTNVRIVTDAQLRKTTKNGKAEFVLGARGRSTGIGFFPSHGEGTSQQCATSVGSQGPAHFQPETMFREAFNDRAQLTNQTAYIGVPSTVLRRGTVKVAWPKEGGNVDEPNRAQLKWSNVARLTVRTS